MRKTIILRETVFNRIMSSLLKEEQAQSCDGGIAERLNCMKKSGIGNLYLPMAKRTPVSVMWKNKQDNSKRAVFDGNIGNLPSIVKSSYDLCMSNPTSDNIEKYRRHAYNIVEHWSESARTVAKKAANNSLLSILEPQPINGTFCDFFGLVCKLYYMPCLLESLYCDDRFSSLRNDFDAAISGVIGLCRKVQTSNSFGSFSGQNLKLLFPLEWKEFASKRLGLKNGTIEPLLKVDAVSNDTEDEIEFNDDDFKM